MNHLAKWEFEKGYTPHNAKSVYIWGQDFSSLKKAAQDERCPVAYKTVTKRIRNGWDPIEALKTPPRVKPNPLPVKIGGTLYPSLKDAVENLGSIDYWTAYRRLENGWPLEEAVTKPVNKRKSSRYHWW